MKVKSKKKTEIKIEITLTSKEAELLNNCTRHLDRETFTLTGGGIKDPWGVDESVLLWDNLVNQIRGGIEENK